MTLYKYLAPDRIDVLENLNIRFTQPLYLNDPYETNPVITGYETSDEQWEKICKIECERNGLNYEDHKHLNDQKLRDELFPGALQLMKVFFHHSTGILSLSETFDNALMWAHYCLNHKGYVIEFNSDHSFFKSNNKDYVIENVSQVIYKNNRPNVTLEKLSMKDLYFTKSTEWSYEKEWRILKSIQKSDVKIDNGIISLFKLPAEIVKGIYLGAACSEELEIRILNAIKKNKLECKLNKMVLNPSNYNIDMVTITEWNDLKKQISKESNLLRAMNDIREYLYTPPI